MRTEDRTYSTPAIVLLAIFTIVSLIGYTLNIADFIEMDQVTNGEGILRAIGVIIVPLGIIMGLFV